MRMGRDWLFGVENEIVRLLVGWFLGRWLMSEVKLRGSRESFM